MVAFNNMSVTFGQLLASALGAGFAQVKGEGWRATVGVGAAPALILAGLLFTCPESPRQLVFHGHLEEADAVLRRIYPKSTIEQRQAKIRSIELSLHETTDSMSEESVWVAFRRIFTTPSTGRAVFTACMIMAISQLGGFNTLMYYAATVFSIVGFDNPTAVGITVSGTNFVFSIVNLALVDKFGRRMIMMTTVLGMAVCMAVTVAAFRYIPVDTTTLTVESSNIGWPGGLVLAAIICYVACYSSGVATIAWIGTELIPLEVRAVGTMMVCLSSLLLSSPAYANERPEYRDLLEHQHHHLFDIPIDDKKLDAEWCLWILYWNLLHWLALCRFLLSRMQGHASRSYPRGVQSWVRGPVLQTVAEGPQARCQGPDDCYRPLKWGVDLVIDCIFNSTTGIYRWRLVDWYLRW